MTGKNRHLLSLSKLVKNMANKEGKIVVVVGTMADDERIYGNVNMPVVMQTRGPAETGHTKRRRLYSVLRAGWTRIVWQRKTSLKPDTRHFRSSAGHSRRATSSCTTATLNSNGQAEHEGQEEGEEEERGEKERKREEVWRRERKKVVEEGGRRVERKVVTDVTDSQEQQKEEEK